MAKQTFVCPNCNNSSTFNYESSVYRHPTNVNENSVHHVIRCDVCEELTYKVIKTERIYRGNYTPLELKSDEEILLFISKIIDDLYTQNRKVKELSKVVSSAGQKAKKKRGK